MRLGSLVFVAMLAISGAAAAQAPDRVGPPPQQARAIPAPKIAPPATPPRPAQSFASGGVTGALTGFQPLRPFPPLVGLPFAGDPSPQCRAACAKIHNQCSGQGEDSCDSNWTQCLAGCRTGR